MTSSNQPGSVQPLSLGNVVSAGVRLYSSHFQQYLWISLIANLWQLLPLAVLFGIALGAIVLISSAPDPAERALTLIPVFLLGFIALVVLWVFCVAKSLGNGAAIARLAFGELIQQPESTHDARRFTNSRKWGFWLIQLLIGLIFSSIVFGFYLLFAILLGIFFVAVGVSTQSGNPDDLSAIFGDANVAIGLVFLLLLLVMLIAFVALLLWFSARFVAADLPLATEYETAPIQSIGRSWELTNKNAWRIAMILFVAGLITIPIYLLNQVIVSVLDQVFLATLSEESPFYWLFSLGSSYAFGLLINILILPFWQSIKAVIFYDLRSRREGFGLRLSDR